MSAALPFLSFCIPSYNRRERVKTLVNSLLSLPDSDIQVVVLDNNSTDGTFEALATIGDSRFIYAANPENRGALFNMVNVFSHATGEYVVYSTDQDSIIVDQLFRFKSFLRENPNITCGYCEFNPTPESCHKIYPQGFSAIKALAYKGRHPTGYFFQNKALQEIRLSQRFSDYRVVDLFPLEFAFAEIGSTGDGAVYAGNLFIPNDTSDVEEHKSSTTIGTSKYAFFAPAARLKLAISYSRHMLSLNLSSSERDELLAQIFGYEHYMATYGYKWYLSNPRLCIHYQMEPRSMGRHELRRISAGFCIKYFIALLGINFTSAMHVLSYLLKAVSRRFLAKLKLS